MHKRIHDDCSTRFCKEVEKLTTSIFLTQLLGSTYNISLVGFKLAGVSKKIIENIAHEPAFTPMLSVMSTIAGRSR